MEQYVELVDSLLRRRHSVRAPPPAPFSSLRSAQAFRCDRAQSSSFAAMHGVCGRWLGSNEAPDHRGSTSRQTA